MKSFLVVGIASLCGCSLIVGTETPVVRDSGAGDSSSDAGACSCVDTASSCRKTCSNTESTCESGCDNQPNKDACRSACQSTGQTCSQTCTSTCTACVAANGCGSASKCSSN
ncbi:MAG TPA: hypothetical protein VF316_19580 [Polyangiaceae bacterium]